MDITAIEITRERVVPPPPRHPERYWVQVAIGRNLSALRRDWRQIKRRAEGQTIVMHTAQLTPPKTSD